MNNKYTISENDFVDIINGTENLRVSISAMLTLWNALNTKGFNVDNEMIAHTLMLITKQIEEVETNLKKIQFEEYIEK